MSAPGNGVRFYQVDASGVIRSALRALHRLALQQGRGEAVTRAFRQIIRRLERDPLHFGEPAFPLPSLRMQVRTASIRPLTIHFAVCEDRRFVIIKGLKLLAARES
jgi:hypothetical protein